MLSLNELKPLILNFILKKNKLKLKSWYKQILNWKLSEKYDEIIKIETK